MSQNDIEFLRSIGLVVMPLVPPEEEGKKPKPMFDGWTEMGAEELERGLSKTNLYGVRVKPPLLVVDVDDRRLARLVEDDFPPTLTVETKDGYHYYYKTNGRHLENMNKSAFIQLLANSRYAVSPPTVWDGHRYRFVNKVPPATIDSHAVEKLERMLRALGKYENLIKGFAAFWVEGHRHNLSLWLNGALRKAGLDRFKAAVVVKAICLLAGDGELRDRLEALKTTYEREMNEIAGWSRLESELEAIVGVDRARELLSLLPRPKKTEHAEGADKPRSRYIVGGEVLPDGSLVEVVEGPRLLVYKEGKFEVHKSLEVDGVVYNPYPHLPFALPRAPESLDVDPELWRDTKSFVMEYFDAPDERVYDVIVAGVAWSYFYREIRKSTPYLLFLGPWRSGKTRALEVFTALGHRALQVVDPSEASIFRIIEEFKPLLVIDEANVLDPNILAILAAAYRYGAVIPRVVDPDKGLDGIRMFHVFAFVVYASREQPRDDIFSRSVTVFCEKAVRQTKKLIDEEKAAALRTRWFAQRLRLYNKVRMTFAEFESEDGRMQELFSPLLVMSRLFGDPEAERNIVSYGREIETRVRALETTSEEAEVVEAVVKAIEERARDAPEYLLNSEIINHLNGEWEPRKLGKLMTRLGFRKVKLTGGVRGYLIDYRLLARLVRRYEVKSSVIPPIENPIASFPK
jgi:hypothetical protein